ncbi:unnamed protein product [Urochloa decumbens]|uniref:At1g61320/AtMIF1 LRR domain-containing protein n=1 Tax=Urochloa decumbens TaxID=240449 RepID=A0ABC9BVC2_9POAL
METPALQSEQQRPRQTLASNGSVAPLDEIQGSPSPYHRVDDGDSKDGETSRYSILDLPEDILRHIHSLMPMDAAARAACISHAFLSSWRCYPKLILSWQMLCSKALAVTPDIEELTLKLYKKYKFPCSILSDGARKSIRSLQLDSCVLRPTPELGPLRSLTRLRLRSVCITGDELECLLSNSLALEHLDLNNCNEIIILKIPSVLQRLSYMEVFGCLNLRVVENKAPSLTSFTLTGEVPELSFGEASQMMKVLGLHRANVVYYARAKLPSIMPNLETLDLSSSTEVDTPMLPTKFLNLKHLAIQISVETFSPSYDYFSLASFLDACPSLETWNLDVYPEDMEHESIFGGASHLRQLPEFRHNHLKSVEIMGFSSAKCLVELTCYIVKSAVSLERLTLDTLHGGGRCSGQDDNGPFCWSYSKAVVEEASRGVAAIREYIKEKVPPTVKLIVHEPCPRCHATAVDYDR